MCGKNGSMYKMMVIGGQDRLICHSLELGQVTLLLQDALGLLAVLPRFQSSSRSCHTSSRLTGHQDLPNINNLFSLMALSTNSLAFADISGDTWDESVEPSLNDVAG